MTDFIHTGPITPEGLPAPCLRWSNGTTIGMERTHDRTT
jgi:hypothetical protein